MYDESRGNATGPDRGPVPIAREILEGVEAVRRSGLTNMLDRPRVAQLAAEMGYPETSLWIQRHRDLYSRAIFQGFKAEDQEGGEE